MWIRSSNVWRLQWPTLTSAFFYAAQVHIPDIEQCIQTVHNCYQTGYHCLPYNTIPKPMVIALAKRCVKFLNMFPLKGSISSYYSPQAIITNKPIDYNITCTHPFGCYVQANHESQSTNSPAAYTLDYIFWIQMIAQPEDLNCSTLPPTKSSPAKLSLKSPFLPLWLSMSRSLHNMIKCPSSFNFSSPPMASSPLTVTMMLCLQEWMTTIKSRSGRQWARLRQQWQTTTIGICRLQIRFWWWRLWQWWKYWLQWINKTSRRPTNTNESQPNHHQRWSNWRTWARTTNKTSTTVQSTTNYEYCQHQHTILWQSTTPSSQKVHQTIEK